MNVFFLANQSWQGLVIYHGWAFGNLSVFIFPYPLCFCSGGVRMKVVNEVPLWGWRPETWDCDNTPVTSRLVPPPEPVMGITAGGGAA